MVVHRRSTRTRPGTLMYGPLATVAHLDSQYRAWSSSSECARLLQAGPAGRRHRQACSSWYDSRRGPIPLALCKILLCSATLPAALYASQALLPAPHPGTLCSHRWVVLSPDRTRSEQVEFSCTQPWSPMHPIPVRKRPAGFFAHGNMLPAPGTGVLAADRGRGRCCRKHERRCSLAPAC